MSKKTKKEIEIMLEKFYFVDWDRYVFDKGTKQYTLYGWIERKGDAYKDFLELGYNAKDGEWDFNTSSAEKHDEICQILDIECEDSNHCIRIEETFDVINSIKLKK